MEYKDLVLNDLSEKIIGCALKVHQVLGPGLLESAYQECLKYELQKNSLLVESELPMPIIYETVKLDHGYRIDLLVENKIVIEIKSIEHLTKVHKAQVLTYLRLGRFKLGLLINFHEVLLKHGLKRVVN
jgi:GxxExxY protein